MSPPATSAASSTILFEGHNLALRRGTGIATYARHLGEAARALGYRTEILIGTDRAISAKDPTLAEVTIFDAPRRFNLLHKGMIEVCRAIGVPFGVRPGILQGIGGVVVQPPADLRAFERIHGVPHLLDIERLHFMRHGKALNLKVDLAPALFHATRPAPLAVRGAANIYTIHDAVPVRLPYTTADDKAYHLNMLRSLGRSADHIITVSEHSRNDLIEVAGVDPGRITNTYQSVEFPEALAQRSQDETANEIGKHYCLDFQEYFLFVGAIEPKKNLARLIDAYAASKVDRPLVIVGGLGWMYDEVLEKISSERFLRYARVGRTLRPMRQVQHLSHVPLEHLVSLVKGARALLYPSVYEGFGLPVLEAMLLGTPVMTSNASSLPEIAGDAALLVDPYSVDAIADAIRTLDQDPDVRQDLRTRGLTRAAFFSPEAYKQRVGDVYKRVLG